MIVVIRYRYYASPGSGIGTALRRTVGDLVRQVVMTEDIVVTDEYWLGDVGGGKVLVGRVHCLLAGSQ